MSASTHPALLVGVDTEADDQWSEEGRRRLSVRNAERLPGLQDLFDSFGVRPTYFVSHEMAALETSAAILSSLGRNGRCEIGAHLHPWSCPPYRPEDLRGTYPSQLPDDLLARQLRELTETIEGRLQARPTSYRAGRHGFDKRSLPILESLGYRVDASIDPLFNETRKGGPSFAGAPVRPYHPDYQDVRRPGAAPLLEIPISAGTCPPLPKILERLYVSLPPLPFRPALSRLGLRPVWLRPSYAPLRDALPFADRLVRSGSPCLSVLFHSSEVCPGASPYHPDQAGVDAFLENLKRLFAHLTGRLGAVGRTHAEFAAEWRDGWTRPGGGGR